MSWPTSPESCFRAWISRRVLAALLTLGPLSCVAFDGGAGAAPPSKVAPGNAPGSGSRELVAASGATGAAETAAGARSAALARIGQSGELRVCIWPDYYGVTYRNPRNGQLTGIDIELSAQLAKDLGARLRYVETEFPGLIQDLETSRCDIAMFAIGMTPQRRERIAFSAAYLQSDIYAITTRSSRVIKQWEDIDRPGVVVGVQAGTFMEPVMRERLRQATLQVVNPPATREAELEAGRVDVFMTDYPYSRRLLDNADWMRLVASPTPFHVLPYAYAVRQGDPLWLARVNQFVASIKRDGRLQSAARRYGLGDIVVR